MTFSQPNPLATSGEHILDARNLLCPLPVLKARKRLDAWMASAPQLPQSDPMFRAC